ncbi:hypothetical protein NFIA_065690 [Paecilomyces variotii No. 5]|uniref:Uncharacterized protein n=1 Tax=Byssochlamys spectabilis (strain No. 5 / NBRC 109023) TaxID=1356009 RepID=V5G316_BYSSN|nr:hypothetical protein NFIA_065690 [Paecilomyces variotii No. 5]
MALRTSATNAEDVAAGFMRFREPLPEHATEITGLIADLYGISTSLNALEELTRSADFRCRRNVPLVRPDLELVRASLKYTLEDIVDFFGNIDPRRSATREVYKRTWFELSTFFRREINYSLATRLRKYKLFLRELEDFTADHFPDRGFMSDLREGIKALLEVQDNRLALRIGGLEIGGPASSDSHSTGPSSPMSERLPRMRRSYERHRPPTLPPQSPQSPLSPSTVTFSDMPPSLSEGSTSPTTISTAPSMLSNPVNEHWAKVVFAGDISRTRIPFIGDNSECVGDPHPCLRRFLVENEFEELLQLPFNDGAGFCVYFYVRQEDHRARIVCEVPHTTRSNEYFCYPLNLLEICREGSCLQICRRRRAGTELHLWANLKFNTIEKMVLFFCTFLALRSQDMGKPVSRILDWELDGEEEIFGGQILENNTLHALRIYQDTTSNAVRLQASIHRGEMKRAPLWTAFITHNVQSPGWIRRMDSKTLYLRQLHRRVFFPAEFTLPQGRKQEYILRFATKSDTDDFIEAVEELALNV